MPSTYTSNLKLEKVAYDEQADIWGYTENNGWDCVDQAITGRLDLDLTGLSSPITLTSTNGQPDQARNADYIFRGILTSDVTVVLPNVDRAALFAIDATANSAAFKVSLSVSGSTAPNSTFNLPKNIGVAVTIGGGQIAQLIGGATDAFWISGESSPTADADLYFHTKNRLWVTYVEGATGKWRLVDETASREVIIADSADGSVILPAGTARSYLGGSQAINGWNITPGLVQIFRLNASINTPFLHFVNNGGISGGVTLAAGGGVNYVSNSDCRLKIDYGPFSAWSLPDLSVHEAAWKSQPDNPQPMFFAHEVAEHRPWAVSGEKDAVDEDGGIIPQGVDASKLVPEMWAMIQSLRSRVNALEGRLASCLSLR